ncbi:hypothetical protein AAE478_004478 [Parahypoxylon ruwenzoriense]
MKSASLRPSRGVDLTGSAASTNGNESRLPLFPSLLGLFDTYYSLDILSIRPARATGVVVVEAARLWTWSNVNNGAMSFVLDADEKIASLRELSGL